MKLKRILPLSVIIAPYLVTAQTDNNPNIIYILADDMGYGDVKAFNPHSKIRTPNLDNLAKNGMRFTDAHTTSSVSTPTRYSILTGRYNWRSRLQLGVLWSYSEPLIEKERPTVATLLAQNGYNTAVIGKWHLGLGWERFGDNENDIKFSKINFSPNDNGFDYSFIISASLDIPPYAYIRNYDFTSPITDTIQGQGGYGFYRTSPIAQDFDINNTLERFTDEAMRYIDRESKKDDPYFLYFPLTAPHTPILPPIEFQGKSDINPYADFVMYVDDVVGRIMQQVKESGEEDNTIIIFTSDNGCAVNPANVKLLNKKGHQPNSIYRGAKSDIFDGGHRVPFIVQWKGVVKADTKCDKPISVASLMATCGDVAGYEIPNGCGEDSHSIYDELIGEPKKSSRGERIVIHHSHDGYFAIRQGRWKLNVTPYSGGWSYPSKKDVTDDTPSMQLYDMKRNPEENSQYNLIDKRPEIAKRLYKELKWAVENGATREGVKTKANDVRVVIDKYH